MQEDRDSEALEGRAEAGSEPSGGPRRFGQVVSIVAGFVIVASALYIFVHERPSGGGPSRSTIAAEVVLRGVASQEAGRLADASVLYKAAIAIDPGFAVAYFDLGTVALERGNNEVAEWWLEQALSLQPDNGAARQDLDVARARLSESPDLLHDGLMNEGLEALDQDGAPERAVALLTRVLERRPGHYGAMFQIARALDAAGRRAEARARWQRSLELATAIGDEPTMQHVQRRLAETD